MITNITLSNITTSMLKHRNNTLAPMVRKSVAKTLYKKQFDFSENRIAEYLAPMFEAQIDAAAAKLEKLGASKSASTSANQLASQIHDANEWYDTLIDSALPPIALAMVESAASQLVQLQLSPKQYKASTATEWLNRIGAEQLEDVVFTLPYGRQITLQVASEFPEWLKRNIQNRLEEVFSEDYWADINLTTGGDIEGYLRNGILNGRSIASMAKQMRDDFGEANYPLFRGRMIGRTESGNALNGARSDVIDAFIDDVGLSEFIKKVWLSVLGSTTRDTHASADGVPANKDGVWEIGGWLARWPSDVHLPAHERINCQCTVNTAFGMTDLDAAELLADYDLRKTIIRLSKNCGTGAGGFQPGNVCAGTGGSGGIGSGSITTQSGETLLGASRAESGTWKVGDDDAPEHIQKLGIPPAWKDVYVNPDPKGDLLAKGKDSKGRGQYRYGETHIMKAAANKFGRIRELRKKREMIVKEVDNDINKGHNVEEAVVTKLIIKTGMRPGSVKDTRSKHKSYGATTLEGRHIIANKDGTATIKFVPGKKKGQEITMPVSDKTLAKELIARSKSAGADGRLFDTTASNVRKYSKSKDGKGFKTKDHRTALGTDTAVQLIQDMPKPKSVKEYKSAVKQVSEGVSNVLGNTPSIAFKSYIDPNVWAAWRTAAGV